MYRYIADNADQLDVVVDANYNLATSLIRIGEALSDELADLFESDAANLKTKILLIQSSTIPRPSNYYAWCCAITLIICSARNLEWLTLREHARQNFNNPQQSSQQQGEQQQQQQSDEQGEPQEQQSDEEGESQDANQQQSDQPQRQ